MQLVLQHCCKTSLIALFRCFSSHIQAYLATIQVIADCKNLLQKVESGPFFATKSLLVARFTGLKQTRFSASLHNRRFMSQARRTRHFARSARRGEEKKIKLYFFSSLRFALRAKCRVRLAWLIKHLLCRLFCSK